MINLYKPFFYKKSLIGGSGELSDQSEVHLDPRKTRRLNDDLRFRLKQSRQNEKKCEEQLCNIRRKYDEQLRNVRRKYEEQLRNGRRIIRNLGAAELKLDQLALVLFNDSGDEDVSSSTRPRPNNKPQGLPDNRKLLI